MDQNLNNSVEIQNSKMFEGLLKQLESPDKQLQYESLHQLHFLCQYQLKSSLSCKILVLCENFQLLTKRISHESVEQVGMILEILLNCLKSNNSQEAAVKILSSNTLTSLKDLLMKTEFLCLQNSVLQLLSKLARCFESVSFFIESEIASYLKMFFQNMNEETFETQNDFRVQLELVSVIIAHLFKTSTGAKHLLDKEILKDMFELWQKHQQPEVLTTYIIHLLEQIKESPLANEIISSNLFWLQLLLHEIISYKLFELYESLKEVINHMIPDETLENMLVQCQENKADEKCILFTGMLQKKFRLSSLIHDENFFNNLIDKFDKSSDQFEMVGILQLLKQMITANQDFFQKLKKTSFLKNILDKLQQKEISIVQRQIFIFLDIFFNKDLNIPTSFSLGDFPSLIREILNNMLAFARGVKVFPKSIYVAINFKEYTKGAFSKKYGVSEDYDGLLVLSERSSDIMLTLHSIFPKFIKLIENHIKYQHKNKDEYQEENFIDSILEFRRRTNDSENLVILLEFLLQLGITDVLGRSLTKNSFFAELIETVQSKKEDNLIINSHVVKFMHEISSLHSAIKNKENKKQIITLVTEIHDQEYLSIIHKNQQAKKAQSSMNPNQKIMRQELRDKLKNKVKRLAKLLFSGSKFNMLLKRLDIDANTSQIDKLKENDFAENIKQLVLFNNSSIVLREGMMLKVPQSLFQFLIQMTNKKCAQQDDIIYMCLLALAKYFNVVKDQENQKYYQHAKISQKLLQTQLLLLRTTQSEEFAQKVLDSIYKWFHQVDSLHKKNKVFKEKNEFKDSFLLISGKKEESYLLNLQDTLTQILLSFQESSVVQKQALSIVNVVGQYCPQWKRISSFHFVIILLNLIEQGKIHESNMNYTLNTLNHLFGLDDTQSLTDSQIRILKNQNLLQSLQLLNVDNFSFEKMTMIQNLIACLENEKEGTDVQNANAIHDLMDLKESLQSFGGSQQEREQSLNLLKKVVSSGISRNFQRQMNNHNYYQKIKQIFIESCESLRSEKNASSQYFEKKVFSLCLLGLNLYMNSLMEEEIKIFVSEESNKPVLLASLQILEIENRNFQIDFFLFSFLKYFVHHSKPLILQEIKSLNLEGQIMSCYRKNKNCPIKKHLWNISSITMNFKMDENEDKVHRFLQNSCSRIQEKFSKHNTQKIYNFWMNVLPYVKSKIFILNFREFQVPIIVANTLNLMKTQIEKKMKKKTSEFIEEIIGNSTEPRKTIRHTKILNLEIELARFLTDIILNLSQENMESLTQSEEIAKNIDVLGVLNKNIDVILIINKLLKNKNNIFLLQQNNTLQVVVYLFWNSLIKIQKTSMESDPFISTNKTLEQSLVEIKQSQTDKAQEKKNSVQEVTSRAFREIVIQILLPIQQAKLIQVLSELLIEIDPMNKTNLKDLIYLLRMVYTFLKAIPDQYDIISSADQLKKGISSFLYKFQDSKSFDVNFVFLFQDFLFEVMIRINSTDSSLRNKETWNLFLSKYLIQEFELAVLKPKLIFDLLSINCPQIHSQEFKNHFYESTGKIQFTPIHNQRGMFSIISSEQFPTLIENYFQLISLNEIDELSNLEILNTMTESIIFCKQLFQSKHFRAIFQRFEEVSQNDVPQLYVSYCAILIKMINAIQCYILKNDSLLSDIFHEIPQDEILLPFTSKIEQRDEKCLPYALKFLCLYFDIQRNKSVFKKLNFHQTLKSLLQEEAFNNQADLWVLFCKIVSEPLCKNEIGKEEFLFSLVDDIIKKLFQENTAVKNPTSFSTYQECSNLFQDPNQLIASLQVYLFAELTQDPLIIEKIIEKYSILQPLSFVKEIVSYNHLPIIFLKLLQFCELSVNVINKKGMFVINEEFSQLPFFLETQLQIYNSFNLTKKLLRSIKEYCNISSAQKKPPSYIQRYIDKFLWIQIKNEPNFFNLNEINFILKELLEQLAKGEFQESQKKLLSLIMDQIKNIVKVNNLQIQFELANLEIPKILRSVANSENISTLYKLDSLMILNILSQQVDIVEILLLDDFFIQNSIENIVNFSREIIQEKEVKDATLKILSEELKFMLNLISVEEGTQLVMKTPFNQQLWLQNLLQLVMIQLSDKTKHLIIKIFCEIVKKSDQVDFQAKILVEIPQIIFDNKNSSKLISQVFYYISYFIGKSEECLKKALEFQVLQKAGFQLQLNRGEEKSFLEQSVINMLMAISEYENFKDEVIKCRLFQYLSTVFQQTDVNVSIHRNICKLILLLSYQNDEFKKEIINSNFVLGFTPLFEHYSSKEGKDEEMTIILLKCMANFSLFKKAKNQMLKKKVIQIIGNTLASRRQNGEVVKMIFCMIRNLTYDLNRQQYDLLIENNCEQILFSSMIQNFESGNLEILEIVLDCITHISKSPAILLKIQNESTVLNSLFKILKQQNSILTFKVLRVLSLMILNKNICMLFMTKGGIHLVTHLMTVFQNDDKNFFQIFKILKNIIKNFPDLIHDKLAFMIAERIVSSFRTDINFEISKKIVITLGSLINKYDFLVDFLSKVLVPDLIEAMKNWNSNTKLLLKSLKLLLKLSSSIFTVKQIRLSEGLSFLKETTDKHYLKEQIISLSVKTLHNCVDANAFSVQQLKESKIDSILKKIFDTVNENDNFELNDSCKKILEYIENKEEDSKLETSSLMRDQFSEENAKDLELYIEQNLPAHVKESLQKVYQIKFSNNQEQIYCEMLMAKNNLCFIIKPVSNGELRRDNIYKLADIDSMLEATEDQVPNEFLRGMSLVLKIFMKEKRVIQFESGHQKALWFKNITEMKKTLSQHEAEKRVQK